LSHNLWKSTIIAASRHYKSSLWLFILLHLRLSNQLFDIRALECAFGVWLPLCEVQFVEWVTLGQNLLAAGAEDANHVVNFDAFIKDCSEKITTIGWPLLTDSTIGFKLAHFLNIVKVFQTPYVNLASQVTKATDHCKLREWTDLNGVSKVLTKLKKSIAILIIKRGSRWLHTRDHNESFGIWQPGYIKHLVVEHRDKLAIFSSENLNILKSMLTIVTLTWAICEILRPNKCGMASWGNKYLNLLGSGALDIEFSFFNLVRTSNIININCAIRVFLG